ncbi:MAG: serine protein kinase RIO [Candidatus Woesearchaeota archaeon]
MPRIPRERWKTLKWVFDLFTEQVLFKLISKGIFDGLESPLQMGKEANIFTALTSTGERVIVKIYRLTTADFKKMYQYLATDPRYAGLRKNRRKVIFAWAQREYRNLLKAYEAGVPVPKPKAQLFNVLVMAFVGDLEPAPMLKDCPPKYPRKFFNELVMSLKKLYKAGLVHGDLSAFNILNHNEKPVFIDMSQATTLMDPNARTYLKRDIANLARFFKKVGLRIEEEALIKKIMQEAPEE